MRNLILLRGSMGCGKSTFVKNKNLEAYTLSPDNLRLLIQSPIMLEDGSLGISQNNDRKVWNILFEALENRMSRGEFTIIDATHQTRKSIKAYEELCKKYKYRCFVVDFTDIPIETALEQNKKRPEYKFVPEPAIYRAYKKFETQEIPSFAKEIKREDFDDVIQYKVKDLSQYKAVNFIGDIHGCAEPLKQYLETFKDDEYYVFLGDYIDRGLQNKETLEIMMNLIEKENVDMIEGNHECVSSDTEILTEKGWIKSKDLFNKYDFNTKIANFDIKNKEITFDYALEKHKSFKEDMIEIKSNNIHQIVSFNHDLIINDEKIKAIDALEMDLKEDMFILNANKFNKGVNMSYEEIRLLTWVIMDGTIVDHSKYNKNSTKKRIQFKLSKQRKINELKKLLDNMNIKYTFKPATKSISNKLQPYYIRIYGDYARDIFDKLNGIKQIPKEWQNLNKEQLDVLLDEICKTDGILKSDNKINWSTTNLNDVEVLQKACLFNGYISDYYKYKNSGFKEGYIYRCYIKKYIKKHYKVDRNILKYNDYSYCWSMPKGTLITRLNGKVNFTGNCHIWNYAKYGNEYVTSSVFRNKTQHEIQDISKKELRKFYRKLNQLSYIKYHNKEILACHGGISKIPENLNLIATSDLIKGTGKYDLIIGHSFYDNTKDNEYLIHGHRNTAGSDIEINQRVYNLQGDVEIGGFLRVVSFIGENNVVTKEIKNDYFDEEILKQRMQNRNKKLIDTSCNWINELRNNKHVKEKIFGNISSFNFTKKAFSKRIWDWGTITSRGLFVNIKTEKIVTRGYNKFFNINEIEDNKLENLKSSFKFPLTVYDKPNGFLGLVGYDEESDEFLISSKSTLDSDFSDKFKELFYNKYNDKQRNQLKKIMKNENISLTYEVICPEFDPHIIKYDEDKIVLLDAIKREINFSKFDYKKVKLIGQMFDTDVKDRVETFENWNEFYNWYENIKSDFSIKKEGYVIEDSDEYMLKIKLPYYNFWKRMRQHKARAFKGRKLYIKSDLETGFCEWLQRLDKDILNKSIIELRDMFEKEVLIDYENNDH